MGEEGQCEMSAGSLVTAGGPGDTGMPFARLRGWLSPGASLSLGLCWRSGLRERDQRDREGAARHPDIGIQRHFLLPGNVLCGLRLNAA